MEGVAYFLESLEVDRTSEDQGWHRIHSDLILALKSKQVKTSLRKWLGH
jgi:hypothetical protein